MVVLQSYHLSNSKGRQSEWNRLWTLRYGDKLLHATMERGVMQSMAVRFSYIGDREVGVRDVHAMDFQNIFLSVHKALMKERGSFKKANTLGYGKQLHGAILQESFKSGGYSGRRSDDDMWDDGLSL